MLKSKRGSGPGLKLKMARGVVRALLEAGGPINPKKFHKDYGISEGTFETAIYAEIARREALEEMGVAPWSKKMGDRLNAAIRAYQKKLDIEFEGRVLHEIRRRIETTVLPSLLERELRANRVLQSRKGLMAKRDYRNILACLHPDWVDTVLKKRYEEAFHIFKSLEVLLLDEKQMFTGGNELPRTFADLMARRKVKGEKTKQAMRVR